MNSIWHDVEQNKPAWDELRVGRITSSALSKVMANFGKAFGEPAKKYAVEIAVGQLTGRVSTTNYSNAHMERGHEQEAIAREMYEQQTFSAVTNGGFYEMDDVGCSPDGLVGDSGVIEIKSAIAAIHYGRLCRQSYDPVYRWQLAGNLKFSEREWIDFISYCADFPEEKQLYIYRCYKRDFETEFKQIDTRLVEFRQLIEQCRQNILGNNYEILREN